MQLKLADVARGQWRGILIRLGIPEMALQNKHGPCPICGGTDRFRWDNDGGRGTYICGQCGAGDGISLVMKFKGCSFAEAARQVEEVIGSVTTKDAVAPKVSEDDRRRRIKALLAQCHPVEKGDETDCYLAARGIDEPKLYPADLLTCEKCWFAEGIYLPAMIALVRDPSGNIVNLHRTYLTDGRKANVPDPRRLMPGTLPDGVAIRLGPSNSVMGIAEGIETAIATGHHYEMPVWSALNAGNLAKWLPPSGVEEVVIFGDNDENFIGQATAYQLANRLKRHGFAVDVRNPLLPGTDWADVRLSYLSARNRNKAR